MQNNDLEAAIGLFDKALSLEPRGSIVYANRATAHLSLKRYEQALSDLDQAITLSPNFAMAYLNRGVVHSARGDFDEQWPISPAEHNFNHRTQASITWLARTCTRAAK